MANQYKCIKSDPANGLFEGKPVQPYYEDANEIIVAGGKMDHHIKIGGEYFKNHLEKVGN